MFYSVVVSFILGIVFEQILNFGWSTAVLVFVVTSILFFYLFSKNQKRTFDSLGHNGLSSRKSCFLIFAIGLAFGVGILRMSLVNNSPDPALLSSVDQNISFEATVSEEPDIRETSARYTISLEGSDLKMLLVADRFPEFKYGDEIKISGKLRLPKNFESDTGVDFDYVNYLAKDKIHFVIYQPQIEKVSSGSGFVASLYSLKNVFVEKIGKVVPEPNSSFLAGIIFGAKQSLGEELLDYFKKAGLIHIVVLSGYNITIIAAGIFFLMSYFGKRNLSFAVSAISIILFAIMVGLTATVIRACVMALIAILARFLGRPTDALRWLFIAALLMLLWNPLLLFYDPSFQLSFMATLGLILFSQPIFSFISKYKTSKYIPVKFGTREIVSSTLAVQLFILPLLIKMSGFVSIISFVVNPIILPLVPLTMALGGITGGLGILPFIGNILSWPFGAFSYFLTEIIIRIAEFSASLPLATFQTGVIPLFVIFLWYAFYGFVFWKIRSITIAE